MPKTETRKMVLAAAAVCEDKKAEDTRILELDPADSGFTDFFLITSGNNIRQTQAIADEIELKMKREFQTYANSVEGRRTGEWILMDYVDFVVHIFTEEKRAFYDIERLRKSARSVDVAELKAALAEKTAEVRRSHPAPELRGEADGPRTKASARKTAVKPGRKAAAKPAAAKKTAAKKALGKRAATNSATKKTAAPAKKSATRIAAASQATGKTKAKAPAKKAATKTAATKIARKTSAKRAARDAEE